MRGLVIQPRCIVLSEFLNESGEFALSTKSKKHSFIQRVWLGFGLAAFAIFSLGNPLFVTATVSTAEVAVLEVQEKVPAWFTANSCITGGNSGGSCGA